MIQCLASSQLYCAAAQRETHMKAHNMPQTVLIDGHGGDVKIPTVEDLCAALQDGHDQSKSTAICKGVTPNQGH